MRSPIGRRRISENGSYLWEEIRGDFGWITDYVGVSSHSCLSSSKMSSVLGKPSGSLKVVLFLHTVTVHPIEGQNCKWFWGRWNVGGLWIPVIDRL